MSDIEDFFFEGTTFTKEQIALARINYLAQSDLAIQLTRAAEESDVSMEEAARQLGWAPEAVSEAVHGMRDISLTDLRLLANTFDASLHFQVAARYTHHTRIFAADLAQLDSRWVDSEDWAEPIAPKGRGKG